MKALPLFSSCWLGLFALSLAHGQEAAAPAAPAPAAVSTRYTSEQLTADLARGLAQRYHLEGDLQLELLRSWGAPAQAASTWKLVLLECPGSASANMLVHFRLLADNAIVADSSLLVHASLWRDAWYARQPIAVHTAFSAELVDARRIDAFHERDALPATAGDSSYLLTRDVPADHLLTWHDLARRPLVRKGAVVDVTATEGMLSVTMKALAMENGGQGDLITVRNLESRKDISALVVATNRVEIHF